MNVTFYGVRGSTPSPSEANRRYGGNTSCVALEVDRQPPILCDLGTGARAWGETIATDDSFAGTVLLSHLHWDHVQGLPFFTPIDRPGAQLDVYGPGQGDASLGHLFDQLMRPPYFPIRASELRGEVRFHDVVEADLAIGTAKVSIRPVPHRGPTLGFRIEWGGVVVSYISDHQEPEDGSGLVAEDVLELCDGADLLIHDAQYTREEFETKRHWGHSTVDFAVRVADTAGVRALVLFHHDPGHSDDKVDELLAGARRLAERTSLEEVMAASEGLTIAYNRG